MREWRNSLSDNEFPLYSLLLTTLIGIFGYFIKRLLDRKTPPTNNINHYGITLAEHEQSLKVSEAEICDELAKAHTDGYTLLEIELREVQQQLQNTLTNYEVHIANLKNALAN